MFDIHHIILKIQENTDVESIYQLCSKHFFFFLLERFIVQVITAATLVIVKLINETTRFDKRVTHATHCHDTRIKFCGSMESHHKKFSAR